MGTVGPGGGRRRGDNVSGRGGSVQFAVGMEGREEKEK